MRRGKGMINICLQQKDHFERRAARLKTKLAREY
jgi:hypothetical protein